MPLRFIMWNVQHGSAGYIQTPNGKNIVVDLGAGDDFSPLTHLWREGVRKLDHVTITHPHMDHIEDIVYFDAFEPQTLKIPSHLTEKDIRGGNPKPSPEADQKIRTYLDIKRRYSGAANLQDNVCLLQNSGGASLLMFNPVKASTGNLNNHSVVTTVEYNGVKILIPGDNESASWEELLGQPLFRIAIANTHVLVAAHHGRESGFYRPLFDHIRPLITLISDGRTVGTSVTSWYDAVTQGYQVRRRSDGTMRVRKCVTTRNDGSIVVEVGANSAGRGTLEVTVG